MNILLYLMEITRTIGCFVDFRCRKSIHMCTITPVIVGPKITHYNGCNFTRNIFHSGIYRSRKTFARNLFSFFCFNFRLSVFLRSARYEIDGSSVAPREIINEVLNRVINRDLSVVLGVSTKVRRAFRELINTSEERTYVRYALRDATRIFPRCRPGEKHVVVRARRTFH